MSRISDMLTMQNKLNNYTNGEGWKKGMTSEGLVINWPLHIILESVELICSFPHKHWKNIAWTEEELAKGLENSRMELVDIWHFVLSQLITEYGDDDYEIGGGLPPHLLDDIKMDLAKLESKFVKKNFKSANVAEVIDATNKLIHYFSAPHVAMTPTTFRIMFEIAQTLDMSFNDIYKLYMLKNVLNAFRQDNGYRDGSYIKIWNIGGVEEEDNWWLKKLMEEEGGDAESLETRLSKLYAQIS